MTWVLPWPAGRGNRGGLGATLDVLIAFMYCV